MAVLVGSGYGTLDLKLDGLRRAAAEARGILTQLDRDATSLTRTRPVRLVDGQAAASSARSVRQLTAEADKALREFERVERQLRKTTDAEIAAAKATGDYARALDLLDRELNAATRDSERYFQIQSRIAQTRTQQAARGAGGSAGFGAAAIGDIKGVAAGILSVNAALAATTAVAGSFRDAFNFKTELDSTNASIAVQLRGVRDVGQVYAEARQYAEQYKLTQQETTNTIQASIGILRESNASVADTFGVLQRLTVLAPGKTIEEAAFAVRELASGDIISISDQFNISKDKAYEMRDAIVAGADPITVLNKYLTDANVTMEALKVRTEGAAGAMKDLAIAQEDLKIAQAEWAAGPGLWILEQQTKATIGATRAISGPDGLRAAFAGLAQDWGLTTGQASALFGVFVASEAQAKALGSATQDVTRATVDYADAAARGARGSSDQSNAAAATAEELRKQTAATILAKVETELLAQKQQDLYDAALAAAQGADSIEGAAARLAAQFPITTSEAERLIGALRELNNQGAAASNISLKQQENAFRVNPFRPQTQEDRATQYAAERQAAAQQAQAQRQRQRELQEARDRQTQALETTAQKVARLRREEAAALKGSGKDSAAYVDAQTARIEAERQLASERERGATKATTAARKTTVDLKREQDQQVRDQVETYRRLRQAQEDFNLSSSRRQEDYQRERQRLLAEGRRFEAERLRETFERDQRRAAEDFAISQARQREQGGLPNNATVAQTAQAQSLVSQSAGAVTQPGGPGAAAGVSGATPVRLDIQIQPTSIAIDGQNIFTVTWPLISQQLDINLSDAIARVGLSSAPRAAPNPLAGPRP